MPANYHFTSPEIILKDWLIGKARTCPVCLEVFQTRKDFRIHHKRSLNRELVLCEVA